MVKGYSEYNSTHNKKEAEKIKLEIKNNGYGTRIIPQKITKGSAKGALTYIILKSDKKIKSNKISNYENKIRNIIEKEKEGNIKIISDIKKSSSSNGNYFVFVSEKITDYRGYTRTVEQPKSFWTKKEAEAFVKNYS